MQVTPKFRIQTWGPQLLVQSAPTGSADVEIDPDLRMSCVEGLSILSLEKALTTAGSNDSGPTEFILEKYK